MWRHRLRYQKPRQLQALASVLYFGVVTRSAPRCQAWLAFARSGYARKDHNRTPETAFQYQPIKLEMVLTTPAQVVTHATTNGNQFAFIHARTGCSSSYNRRTPLGVSPRAYACCRLPFISLPGSKCPEPTSASTKTLTFPSYPMLNSGYKLNNRFDAFVGTPSKLPIAPQSFTVTRTSSSVLRFPTPHLIFVDF